MPAAEYETRTDSVLAWKKNQKLGRFDPNAPSIEQQKILASEREVEERGKLRNCVIVCSRTRTFVATHTSKSKRRRKSKCCGRCKRCSCYPLRAVCRAPNHGASSVSQNGQPHIIKIGDPSKGFDVSHPAIYYKRGNMSEWVNVGRYVAGFCSCLPSGHIRSGELHGEFRRAHQDCDMAFSAPRHSSDRHRNIQSSNWEPASLSQSLP